MSLLLVLSVSFCIVLITIIACSFDVQSIEKLNGNNFHTWKMKIQFFLHEKDLWEIISKELLPSKIEFEEMFLKENIHEFIFFHEERQVVSLNIILNVVDILWHHVTYD
jgi:uncharacterized protein YehS (DUF1456 family)